MYYYVPTGQYALVLYLLVFCTLLNSSIESKKVIRPSSSSYVSTVTLDNQNPLGEELLTNNPSTLQTVPSIRAASFMVDPLIIIALIALPTIGMLGLSSLVMPLIPIGIYLIQQFFPANAGRRRRAAVHPSELSKQFEKRIHLILNNFYQMMDKFAATH